MTEKTTLHQLKDEVSQSEILSDSAKIIVCAFIDNKFDTERSQLVDSYNETSKVFDEYGRIKALMSADQYLKQIYGI